MMGIPVRRLLVGGTLLGLVAGGVTLLWLGRRPPVPELARLPDLVHDRVVERIAGDLEVPHHMHRALIPPIPRDPSDALRERLARALEDHARLEVELPPRRADLVGSDPDLGSLLQALASTWQDWLVREWTGESPDLMLVAQVEEFADDEHRVALAVHWQARSVADPHGPPLASGQAMAEVAKHWRDPDYLRARILDASPALRFGVWVALLVVPPLVLLGPIRRALVRESNLKNLQLMLLCMTLPALGAWVLTGFADTVWGGGLALLGVAAAGGFAYVFLSLIEELRH